MKIGFDQNIGFIGVGNMGFPMALRLIQSGYKVTVFDLNLEPLEQLSKSGASVAKHIAAHGAFSRAAARYGNEVGELHVAKRIEDDEGISFRLESDWVPPWEQ